MRHNTVLLCSSDRLPVDQNNFDIALSLENVEHLYSEQVIKAIDEMKRVAKTIIISTPTPAMCINLPWLMPEIVEAIRDNAPIDDGELTSWSMQYINQL